MLRPNKLTLSSDNHTKRADQNKRKMLTNFSIDSIMSSKGQASSPCRDSDLRLSAQLAPEPPSPVKSKKAKKFRPKNFQCPVCRMAFSNNGQLKNHVRIHTGERPFACNHPTCNKTFTRNEELTRHKLIHTGIRPHPCPTCGKRFGRKDHLKKHVRTHERKKIRRRNFVSNQRQQSSSIRSEQTSIGKVIDCCNESLGSISRPNMTELDHDSKQNIAQIIYQQTQMHVTHPHSSPIQTIPELGVIPNPASIHLPSSSLHLQPITTTITLQTPSISTPSQTLQQLATSYWSRWYNLIGYYNRNNEQPSLHDGINELFKG